MTKKDVISIALQCFGLSYDKIGADSDEVRRCELFLKSAEGNCARYRDWSFLMKNRSYTQDDLIEGEGFRNMAYCYKKPSDMVKILYINDRYNENVYVIGSNIYTSVENPKITYVSDTVDYDEWSYPELYGYLIGYMLASLVVNLFRPDDPTMSQNISGMFNLTYQSLVQADIGSGRRKNPPRDMFVVSAPSEDELELY